MSETYELVPIVTYAGLQRAFSAQQEGIHLRISHVGLGSAGYSPDRNQRALKGEQIRLEIASASVHPEDYLIDYSIAVPKDTPEFWVRELGWFLEDGTLFMVWSSPEVKLGWKSKHLVLLLALRVKLTEVPVDVVQIVEAQPDLRLLYAEEFANVGAGVAALANSLHALSLKVEDNQDRIDVQEQNMKSLRQYVDQETLLLRGADARLQEAIIANAAQIVAIQKLKVEDKLTAFAG
jgi:hypothetical protein